MDALISFGEWVKRRRGALGLTQDGLARRIYCSLAMIRKIEADERRPSQQLAELLTEHLALKADKQQLFVLIARGERGVEHLPPPEDLAAAEALPDPIAFPSLPMPPTGLIGRNHNIVAVRALLLRADVHLVTLTGPPGIGKTRLSIAVAADIQDQFADGIAFIPLTPIQEPNLVISTIGQALGVMESAGRPLLDGLKAFLRERQVLLVLDNFEQVLQATPQIAELIASAPHLKLLVTSRVALRLLSEQRFVVPPLALPGMNRLHSAPDLVDVLSGYAAIELFVQRAQAVTQTFTLTPENAVAIAAICVRVDGLPLAIELAATRIALFTPQELLARLEHRLALLTGGALDLPVRQQTLRGAIAWSYGLLSDSEQTLLRRLGIFVGGFTLSAAERISNEADLGISVLDGVAALIDKSLVYQADGAHQPKTGETRFALLETIREFALEQLTVSGEATTIRQQHAHVFLTLAEVSSSYRYGAMQQEWLARLDLDHDNLRAALAWSLTDDDASISLRIAGALGGFWRERGYWSEGRRWLEAALKHSAGQGNILERLEALINLEELVVRGLNDYEQSAAIFTEIQDLAQKLDDPHRHAVILRELGIFKRLLGEHDAARPLLEQAIKCFQALGDDWKRASALMQIGDVFRDLGIYHEAQSCFEQSMAIYHTIGDSRGYFWIHIKLGEIARDQSEYTAARRWLEPAVAYFTGSHSNVGLAWAMTNLAIAELAEGRAERAAELFAQGLIEFHTCGQKVGIAYGLKGLADVLVHQRANLQRAVQLFGASAILLLDIGAGITPGDRVEHDPFLDQARATLEPDKFKAAWIVGQGLSIEQAIAMAIE
jgi:predicted ATPase/transcriptional regulator with XRE-family HTH domain